MTKHFFETMFAALLLMVLGVVNGTARGKSVVWNQVQLLYNSAKYLNVQTVTFTDTATLVRIVVDQMPFNVKFVSSTYLVGDDGREYAIKGCEEYALDEWMPVKGKPAAHITLLFQPLPRNTKAIDLVEGFQQGRFLLLGLHNARKGLDIKPYAYDDHALDSLRQAFFQPGEMCVRGRFEQLPPPDQRMGEILGGVGRGSEDAMLAVPVEADGTFQCRYQVASPSLSCLRLGSQWVLFYAAPGQEVDITVRADGSVAYTDAHGGRTPIGNYLRSQMDDVELYDFGEMMKAKRSLPLKAMAQLLQPLAETGLRLCDYMAPRYGFSALEYTVARNEMHTRLAAQLMDNELKWNLSGRNKEGYADISDMNNLTLFRTLPAHDVLLLMSKAFEQLENRYAYCKMLTDCTCKEAEGGSGDVMVYEQYEPEVADSLCGVFDRKLFGLKDNSVFLKQKALDELGNMLTDVRLPDPSLTPEQQAREQKRHDAEMLRRVERAKAFMPVGDPMRQLPDRMYQRYLGMRDVAYTLPEGKATRLLRNITDAFKGKYVLIDFWSTGCGPCRAAIEREQPVRDSLYTTNRDVAFVFITSDKESPAEVYDEYVGKHLQKAYTYRVPYDEYLLYRELFHFNGIPHYELLDRQGRVLRNSYFLKLHDIHHSVEVLDKVLR